MRAFGIIAGFASLFFIQVCFAQPVPPTNDSPTPDGADRLSRLEKRFEEMEARHRQDMQQKDAEIAELKHRLNQGSGPTTRKADSTTHDLLNEIDQTSASTTEKLPAAEIGKTKSEVKDAAGQKPFAALLPRTPANFNPDMAVVGEYRASYSSDHRNPARNRADIGSVELDLRAAIDPRADGVVILPISRDVANPLFFNGNSPQNANVDTAVEIEEAYFLLHDFGIENLTAKLGRFHLRFGRNNILHSHNWQTIDNNFVNQSFLGAESINARNSAW